MRPLDPRLVRYASAARTFLVLGGLIAVAQAIAIVAFAWLVTDAMTGALAGRGLDEIAPTLGWLVLVVVIRSTLALAQDAAAARSAALVKSELRDRLLETITALGPGWLGSRRSAEIATLLGRGIDALDGYFARYLPQLLLTAIVTPIILVAVFSQDLLSAVILGVCLPIIPVFMILIGWATQAMQKRQWNELTSLSTAFDDMVGGMSTLKAYGRQYRQVDRLRRITQRFRRRTMAVLRVSFLSSFALELAASLSVALVALTIGLRLVSGEIDLVAGLFILLLAPDFFLPIRQVGVNYHAAAEGVEASEHIFELLDAAPAGPVEAVGTTAVDGADVRSGADAGGVAGVVVRNATIAFDGLVAVRGFSAHVHPGDLTVLAGPSGSGKSSLVGALLGFVPFEGDIRVGSLDARDGGALELLAWSGQAATLFPGTVSSNVSMGDDEPSSERVARAMSIAVLDGLDPHSVLQERGSGLSGGQAARVAIARAVYRALSTPGRVLVLDEPSAALDHETEAHLVSNLRDLARTGRTVLVVSHRRAFLDGADTLLTLRPSAIRTIDAAAAPESASATAAGAVRS
ncbi:thiol reductant ABC exporter subunit CydD [Labedella endophytica]|uniref:Thiol reductant ABC exporter subunit CydD n=1 Tax=Labedella endophytica TaxID=1523160 RepID=A0A3S0V842_9MICO|nr:thiol reductant ABC exporter subunit CydD [Labedella endophytica]RUQ97164.1 thiol reductant ABC exporter subunit CydD [Labedella endophytica]